MRILRLCVDKFWLEFIWVILWVILNVVEFVLLIDMLSDMLLLLCEVKDILVWFGFCVRFRKWNFYVNVDVFCFIFSECFNLIFVWEGCFLIIKCVDLISKSWFLVVFMLFKDIISILLFVNFIFCLIVCRSIWRFCNIFFGFDKGVFSE